MRLKKGLVHIYTGEGKGKTTAALGLSIRALGCGCKVCFFQFFKGGGFSCGEADAIRKLGEGFKFKRFNIGHPCFKAVGARFIAPVGKGLDKSSPYKTRLKKAINEAGRVIKSKRFDLVVLDEILIGVAQGFLDEKIILNIIAEKPKTVELVLTGRGATKKLIDSADYVTYMKEVKHPFHKSICARKGIEF